jgi:hypothetical protein
MTELELDGLTDELDGVVMTLDDALVVTLVVTLEVPPLAAVP